MQYISVIVGGQYGSEGKGHVTAQLVARAAKQAEGGTQVINIRVAGPNAGHTVYDRAGNKFALRQVPVGAVTPGVILYIAPGSEIDLPVLIDEVHSLRKAGHAVPLYVSGEATVLTDDHKLGEKQVGLVSRVGSTGKGIGMARADRLMRSADRVIDNQDVLITLEALDVAIVEPEGLYAHDDFANGADQWIFIEGTQGYGLGLHAGHYPQTTSSDCRAIDFLSMAGISPWRRGADIRVWVACRVYPIRVAGNSGPMEAETSWADLDLPEEFTTVTQKVRRVGQWDGELVKRAVQENGGKSVRLALTMVDQKFPEVKGVVSETYLKTEYPRESATQLADWMRGIAVEVGAPVGMITTSPTAAVIFSDERAF